LFTCQVSAGYIQIDSVEVIPSKPSDTDLITFSISGRFGYVDSSFVYDQFSQDGTFLWLDLYVHKGMLTSTIPWLHSIQVQPLATNNYILEVRAFDNYSGTLQDTYTIDFTVVPEPCTVALLGIGLPLLRAFSKRKI